MEPDHVYFIKYSGGFYTPATFRTDTLYCTNSSVSRYKIQSIKWPLFFCFNWVLCSSQIQV